MHENADHEGDAVTDELVEMQRQLDGKVQDILVEQVKCDRLAPHAMEDINEYGVPLVINDATANVMVMLKQQCSAKIALSKSMQAKLNTAWQEVDATKKVLATSDNNRDIISE